MAQAEHVTTPIPATIAAGIPKSSPNTIRVAHVRLVPALAGHLQARSHSSPDL
jgi:hypothetical protein